jgi:hypothetical protein
MVEAIFSSYLWPPGWNRYGKIPLPLGSTRADITGPEYARLIQVTPHMLAFLQEERFLTAEARHQVGTRTAGNLKKVYNMFVLHAEYHQILVNSKGEKAMEYSHPF